MTDMGDLGNVVRNELSGEDISGKYYDTEARLYALMLQAKRKAKDAILKSGQEQEEWVLKMAIPQSP